MRAFRPGSYANVTATLALVVALGGTGYAAANLPRNSVGSPQIKAKAVRTGDLARDAVRSPQVKAGSLRASDFRADDLPAGPEGPAGPQGPAGTAVAYAAIDVNGALVADRTMGITADDIDPDTTEGAVCFTGLPFSVRSAVVSNNWWGGGDGGQSDVVTSVTVRPANASGTIGDCSGRVLVRTYDLSSGAAADRPFYIWFEA